MSIRYGSAELQEVLREFPWEPRQLARGKPFDLCWVIDLPVSRAQIWPFLADTSRFNRELGLPPREEREKSGELEVTDFIGPFEQRWIEEPWEWVHEHSMQLVRRYEIGAAFWVRSRFVVQDIDAGRACRVLMYFGVVPKNFLWGAVFRLGFRKMMGDFERVLLKCVQQVRAIEKVQIASAGLMHTPDPLSADAASRADSLIAKLEAEKHASTALAGRIRSLIFEADAMDVKRIEVLKLAEAWQLDHREVLTGFLYGTRLGLFELTWDVICPHCRGPRASFGALKEVVADADCEVCDIKFSTSSMDSLEVLFHVHPSIRQVPDQQFCAAEPARKKHIKLQRHLEPGEKFVWQTKLEAGRYRIRAKGFAGVTPVTVFGREATSQPPVWTPTAENGQEISATQDIDMVLENPGSSRTTVVVEDAAGKVALTPAMVFQHPDFREWFSAEVLGTDVKLQLGTHAIFFSDIVGSTRMYNTIGDSKAFVVVREHFRTIFEEIRNTDGAVIKTIGDAVMAAFSDPVKALKAAVRIQERFSEARATTPDTVHIRISLHVGKVLAVHLDSGLDYFGSTVNYAAKLQQLADAGEIAMSMEMMEATSNTQRRYLIRNDRIEIAGIEEPQNVAIMETTVVKSKHAVA